MKKIVFSASVLSMFVFVQNVLAATCEVNGQSVPCDQMSKGLMVFMGIFWIIFIVFMVGALVLWVWMLVDAVKNEKENLALWLVVLFIAGFLGAIIYYFVRYREHKKASMQQTSQQILSEGEEK